MSILQIGRSITADAFRLAELGHDVVAMSDNISEITEARAQVHATGIRTVRFVDVKLGHVVSSAFGKRFDAVLLQNVLQQQHPLAGKRLIRDAKTLAQDNGFNAISGLLVNPDLPTNRRSERWFAPRQLHDIYETDPNWQMLSYEENHPDVTLLAQKHPTSA